MDVTPGGYALVCVTIEREVDARLTRCIVGGWEESDVSRELSLIVTALDWE